MVAPFSLTCTFRQTYKARGHVSCRCMLHDHVLVWIWHISRTWGCVTLTRGRALHLICLFLHFAMHGACLGFCFFKIFKCLTWFLVLQNADSLVFFSFCYLSFVFALFFLLLWFSTFSSLKIQKMTIKDLFSF